MRYVFSGDQDFLYNAYTLQTGDSLTITAGARLVTSPRSGSTLIEATSSTIQNDGTIIGNGRNATLWMHDNVLLMNNGLIQSTSSTPASLSDSGSFLSVIRALDESVSFYGRNNIVNSGQIVAHGAMDGIFSPNTFVDILNTGSISVDQGRSAIWVAAYGYSNSSMVINHGTITGDIRASQGAALNLVNDGVVTGNISNLHFVDNSGTINGAVSLGEASDVFDNSRGTVTGTISGGLGKDLITGGTGRDVIYGDDLANSIYGGDDTIYGGAGDDALYGGYGADTLYGNQGDDLIYGNQGDDWIHAGQGNDTIYGGQGSDIINGGVGNDTLFGNLGDDRFVFAPGFGHDVIGDFSVVSGNNDVIQFLPGTFATYADVQSHMVQQGDNVVIALDAANDIVLQHATVAQLTADHFTFG